SSTSFSLTPVSFTPAAYVGVEPLVVLPVASADASHPVREWIYLVTHVQQSPSDGRLYESAGFKVTRKVDFSLPHGAYERPTAVISQQKHVIFPDTPFELHFGMNPAASWGFDPIVQTRIYRGRQ